MPALSIAPERSPAPMATLASKHVRQKPSLKRKRPMEVDPPADQGSSPKRSVTFSDQVEFSSQEQTRAPEEIQLEVRKALAHHGHGEDDEYNELTAIFAARTDSDEAPSPATLRLYTAALASNISLLDRSCSQLVHAVLGSDWLHQDEQYIELFIRMLGGLVSSYGTWLAPTLKMLAEKFAESMACNTLFRGAG
jgi:RNA polymerase I-specific transcription initiation factor RRN3